LSGIDVLAVLTQHFTVGTDAHGRVVIMQASEQVRAKEAPARVCFVKRSTQFGR